MGYSVSGRCFESVPDADAAAWSAVIPVLSTGSPPTVSVVEYTGTAWQVATYQGGVLQGVQAAPSIAYGSCSPGDAVADGLALGWLVVGVWAIAWSINVLRRALGWGF